MTEYSLLPIEVRDAVLTTAAIEVAVIPLDGFSVIDAPSKTSSDEGTCIGAHFSCKEAKYEINKSMKFLGNFTYAFLNNYYKTKYFEAKCPKKCIFDIFI